ncbi:MAG TPA: rod shape-determining protein MreD [Parafilimonas sp.]|nr:rod shape-determining protein MreD [Parafilimonas sp.]
MSALLRNIIRFVLFILVQVYIFNKVPPVHQFVKPYIYFLFILWLPFNMGRAAQMLVAFIFGLTFDYFSGTPGLHAAPCVLIAYLRPFLLNLLIPQETTQLSFAEPSVKSMGWGSYATYVLLLTFMHTALLVFIEWMEFGDFLYFIGKVTATTLLSLILIFITEMIFPRKGKYRTNAPI